MQGVLLALVIVGLLAVFALNGAGPAARTQTPDEHATPSPPRALEQHVERQLQDGRLLREQQIEQQGG